MTLGFSTEIKGKPTLFVHKIWTGLMSEIGNFYKIYDNYKYDYRLKFGQYWELKSFVGTKPKIHTIREDKKDRWKVGNDIHFVINNRTKNRFQFAPVLKVKSIQKIEIKWKEHRTIVGIKEPKIYINERQFPLFDSKVVELANNDGFDNVNSFFDWFSEDFEGKIIHWTSFTY